jgi:hypothetical protein
MSETVLTKKEQMLEALQRHLGIVSTACKAVGISRVTHYRYMKDPEYKAAVEQITEEAVDFAESHLLKKISEGDTTATIFYLKTKGKARGYVERQEMKIQEVKPLSWFNEVREDLSGLQE